MPMLNSSPFRRSMSGEIGHASRPTATDPQHGRKRVYPGEGDANGGIGPKAKEQLLTNRHQPTIASAFHIAARINQMNRAVILSPHPAPIRPGTNAKATITTKAALTPAFDCPVQRSTNCMLMPLLTNGASGYRCFPSKAQTGKQNDEKHQVTAKKERLRMDHRGNGLGKGRHHSANKHTQHRPCAPIIVASNANNSCGPPA